MARVKGAMMTRKRRNKILKLAKGYWGAKSKHYKMANEQVMKSLQYAYVGRRLKKRDFRRLWITRISAACKINGINYSTFMHGLKLAQIAIDRKILAEMAVNDKAAFAQLVELAKGYWGAKSKHFKMANEQVMKSLKYAYIGRRLKKRDFRQLWIARINAACKMNGMNYSTFMHGLKLANVEINRKMLAELAVNDKAAFTQLTELAKSKLA